MNDILSPELLRKPMDGDFQEPPTTMPKPPAEVAHGCLR